MAVGNLASMILSGALMGVGMLFILLADEPEKAKLGFINIIMFRLELVFSTLR